MREMASGVHWHEDQAAWDQKRITRLQEKLSPPLTPAWSVGESKATLTYVPSLLNRACSTRGVWGSVLALVTVKIELPENTTRYSAADRPATATLKLYIPTVGKPVSAKAAVAEPEPEVKETVEGKNRLPVVAGVDADRLV